ncbi:type 1 glutamine amidotransferase domain-containing protein, partial [Salinisphaera sp.]|uniref:type 1 glutamine amidotransferase domain-containing protein n=1 Tax=Salinisphaera sp. TaxID=1914330 RepID=UPI002D794BDD
MESRGCTLTVATPTGSAPVPDPNSTAVDSAGVCKNWEQPDKFTDGLALHEQLVEQKQIRSLYTLCREGLDGFDGIFFPGGYAPMVDLGCSLEVACALDHFHAHGKPTALFCHGPVALVSTQRGDDFTYTGYRMTSFSAAEEQDTPLGRVLETSVEVLLRDAGGQYGRGDKWSPHVVVDHELITGQNTQSTREVTDAFCNALEA